MFIGMATGAGMAVVLLLGMGAAPEGGGGETNYSGNSAGGLPGAGFGRAGAVMISTGMDTARYRMVVTERFYVVLNSDTGAVRYVPFNGGGEKDLRGGF